MSATSRRLTELLATAPVIPFDNSDRFILFSDCHRGDNSWADDFAHNQGLHFHALQHYLEQGYTYIELGDLKVGIKVAKKDYIYSIGILVMGSKPLHKLSIE